MKIEVTESLFNKKPIEYEIDENGCWIVINRYLGNKGYAQITINKERKQLSHYIYEIFVGKIPNGLYVCHTCDNPKCINPKHLFLGTPMDNMIDRGRKGRTSHIGCSKNPPKGEKNGAAKLKQDDILYIRNSNLSGVELAKKYNVNPHTISRIKTRKRWVDI